MEKEKIDWSQLTPEAAYKKIIEFANRIAFNYSKPAYHQLTEYKFIWDKDAIYNYEGVVYKGRHVFSRKSDNAKFSLSKYAFLPQDQPIEI